MFDWENDRFYLLHSDRFLARRKGLGQAGHVIMTDLRHLA